MNKQNKGITLIALVITIVVLLILAGVTLNIVFNGGLIDKSQNAVDRYKYAQEQETDELLKIQGYFSLSGEVVKEVKDDDGNVIAKLMSDGNGEAFYLPEGFYYVGGVVEDGVVISDNAEDNEKYLGLRDIGKDLVGNQYVWVPVNKRTIKYENHAYVKTAANTSGNIDLGGSTADTGNGGWRTYYYRTFVDWKDGHFTGTTTGKKADGVTNKTIYNYEDETSLNSASVEKYGGFYIARYEAGYAPATAGTQHTAGKNNSSKAPVSKAYYQTWNNVSQVNASLACDKLNEIENYSNVRARLVDGVAWDTAVNFISSKVNSVVDSRDYGAYYNGTAEEDHLIYYPFMYIYERASGAGAGWYQTRYYKDSGDTKIKLSITEMTTDEQKEEVKEILGVDTLEDAKYRRYIELATGAAESTKVNNIYDLAGNMYEWTTENGYREKSDGTKDASERQFAIRRGGGFIESGNGGAVCSRIGGVTVTFTYLDVGFRSVLYIK